MKIEEIKIGDKSSITKKITKENIEKFAEISGDKNPIHLDDEYAKNSIFKERIAQGILVSGLISAVLANELPGDGTIYLSQSLKFLKPVKINDFITAEVEVKKIDYKKNRVTLITNCFNQYGVIVITGEAVVMLSK